MERELKAVVGPQATDRHNAIIDLADGAQVLAGHMVGLVTRFAVPAIIDDEDSFLVRSRAGVIQEQLQAAGVDGFTIPGGLGEEVLEFLHLGMLGILDGPGPSQTSESLVPISGKQQALQIGPEGFPLSCLGSAVIELGSVVFQGPGSRRDGFAFRHGFPPPPSLPSYNRC
jgi:hypothetical protein